MVLIEQVTLHDLVHPDKPIRYTFQASKHWVRVVHTSSNRRYVYMMDKPEARQLWKQLKSEAYTEE